MAAFDEMTAGGGVRAPYADYRRWLDVQDAEALARKASDAEDVFRRTGITFAVYGDEQADERLIPFDIVPRILSAAEWTRLSRGIEQRVQAINSFLHDIYHRQDVIRAGVLPLRLIADNAAFLPQMIGMTPPGGIYTHIVGTDLVRTGEGEFHVLEDNCRTPSGVSYMLENRETMMQLFPELFTQNRVEPIEDYPKMLRRSLAAARPANVPGQPSIAVLTPGIHNSAYYEHAFLADQMGVQLVEGRDLRVVDGHIAMRTTEGYRRIDVLYRRIDDEYLDPLSFRPDSLLGVPGIMDVYRAGNITIANAPGTGIADDKAIYSYMPQIIRFYTGEEPILANIDTFRCSEPDSLAHVLDRLDELVVKEVHGSGGYGMLVGPAATRAEREAFAAKLRARPDNYIAQPTLALSTCPVLTKAGLAPRHVDLRPFVLVGEGVRIVPGGLTRVALKEGSLVVNSSQGGGTKDTWVLRDAPAPRPVQSRRGQMQQQWQGSQGQDGAGQSQGGSPGHAAGGSQGQSQGLPRGQPPSRAQSQAQPQPQDQSQGQSQPQTQNQSQGQSQGQPPSGPSSQAQPQGRLPDRPPSLAVPPAPGTSALAQSGGGAR